MTFRSPGRLGRWLRRLLIASVALGVVEQIVFFARIRSARFVIHVGALPGTTRIPHPIPAPLTLIGSLLSWTTVVIWLVWQHRVTENLWALGTPIRTTPGWAVGWWFVPIADLWMPAVVMARVYRTSVRDHDRPGRLGVVIGWWIAYMGPGLVVVAFLAKNVFRELPAIRRAAHAGASTIDLTPLFQIPLALRVAIVVSALVAGALAVTIVDRIDRAHEGLGALVPIPPRPDLGLS